MDADFIARLERRALASHGLPPPSSDGDSSMRPLPVPQVSFEGGRGEQEDEDDTEDGDDADEALRQIGEFTEEGDDENSGEVEMSLEQQQTNGAENRDMDDPGGPAEDGEDDEDDATTDSDEDSRPKKQEAMPTIRLTLALPIQSTVTCVADRTWDLEPRNVHPTWSSLATFSTTERSVSLMAKEAGYKLPADTAITFGAGAPGEDEVINEPQFDGIPSDSGPPPKRRRRKRIQERDEGYDKDDPFVDDSEALTMEPKFYHQPLREGFHVACGRISLKSDHQKPKARKPGPKGPRKVSAALPINNQTVPGFASPQQHVLPNTLAGPSASGKLASSISDRHSRAPGGTEGGDSANTNPMPVLPPVSHAAAGGVRPPSSSTSKKPFYKPEKSDSQPMLNQQGPLDSVQLANPSSNRSPLQPSGPSEDRFGTPLNPISLLDDEDSHHKSSKPPIKPRPSPMSDKQTVMSTGLPPAASDNTVTTGRPSFRTSFLKARQGPERQKGEPLAKDVEQAILDLKKEVDAASPFPPKKFPPHLKPLTLDVAKLALDLGEYDECFFIRLAEIFPYNTYTIKKLVKREILPERTAYYEEQIDYRIERLKPLITDGMVTARADYNRAVAEYDYVMRDFNSRQDARQASGSAPNLAASSSAPLPANAATILTESSGNPVDPFGQKDQSMEASKEVEKIPKAPTKNFKFTPAMKELYYEILKLEDELCETICDTQKIVDKNVTMNNTASRKQFYQRLVQLWPDDFMTTAKISREATAVRKKFEGNGPDLRNVTVVE